jgi:protein-disulfide isomerase
LLSLTLDNKIKAMMNRLLTVVLGLSLLLLLIPLSGCEQPRGEIEALKKDVEALKKGQETAEKELKEIKAVLQRVGAIPPPEPKNVVVSVDDDPFLGEKNAEVTIIDFSDYQ